MTDKQIKFCQLGFWQNKILTPSRQEKAGKKWFECVNAGEMYRELPLRCIVYPDHIIYYPYTRHRRSAGYFDGSGWVGVEKKKENRDKVERARAKKRENIIKNSVRVISQNAGVFLTVTTGKVDIPTKSFSRLLEKMRKEHGLLYYTWVKEYTDKGYIHYHVAAVFTRRGLSAYFYLLSKNKETGLPRIVELSNWFARRIGLHECGNSIRLGWDYRNGKPKKILLNKGAANYLLKYLQKGHSDERMFGKRRWGTNLDWLRPVRWQLIERISYSNEVHREWQIVSDDDKYLSDICEIPTQPDHIQRVDYKLLMNNLGYWVDCYIRKPSKYYLRGIAKISCINYN